METKQIIITLLIVFLPIILSLMIARKNNFLYGFVWYLFMVSAICFLIGNYLIEDASIGVKTGYLINEGIFSPINLLKDNLKLKNELFYKDWFNTAFLFLVQVVLFIPTKLIRKVRK